MQMISNDALATRTPPPLWLVTDGVAVVGPVNTNLLLRGVANDRIPVDCLVRGAGWSRWRALDKIREIGELRRRQARAPSFTLGKSTWADVVQPSTDERRRLDALMASAADPGEVLLFTLTEAVEAMHAAVGFVHRQRAPFVGFVTSCASGPGAVTALGNVLGPRDPALDVACRGRSFMTSPNGSAAARRTAERLGVIPASGGVLMVPVYCVGMLYAILELGRPDHPFRAADARGLSTIVSAAVDRLELIRN